MRHFISSMLSLIFCLSSISASAARDEFTRWQSCKQDSDCVVTVGICYSALPVHRQHLAVATEAAAQISRISECMASDMRPQDYMAICDRKQCSLKQKVDGKQGTTQGVKK